MPVDTVEVPVARPYPVVVGAGLDLGAVVSDALEPGPCVIFTDSTVGPLYAARVRDALEDAGWRVVGEIEVPSGEASKSMEVYADAVGRLARMGLTRDGTLFALGGGVVGDLGGFVAGTYMRGVDLVMLPTSLLAMVDSAVGGKVGRGPAGRQEPGRRLRQAAARGRATSTGSARCRSARSPTVSPRRSRWACSRAANTSTTWA